ncbi:uncharacterized protein [Misgurnus anguillicaudatus]|uniref:uncharacterized protein isoform X2 n=1 Tax=Misgurnus anguillicaudatus TaxID=75329 RepID=UPI003CCF219C
MCATVGGSRTPPWLRPCRDPNLVLTSSRCLSSIYKRSQSPHLCFDQLCQEAATISKHLEMKADNAELQFSSSFAEKEDQTSDFLDSTDTVNFALHFKASFSAAILRTRVEVNVLLRKCKIYLTKNIDAGGTGRLPYQSLVNHGMTVKVAGLPNSLKKPSYYGRNQLEAILQAAEEISFEIIAVSSLKWTHFLKRHLSRISYSCLVEFD